MKKMEEEGEFSATILQPQDKDNPETYKVRKGKVGGYVEYFTKKDQEFAAREIKKLNPTFGF
ncbi:hypothetical protein H6758_02630 [Candidatus Nomurabacteria bacterium]|nr:hypothetical protein [Candidatus Nomurabacteria bacterium]